MRYYCHHCRTQINADELLPEFTCPSCHSGFIEELPVHHGGGSGGGASASRRNSSVDESNRSDIDDGTPGFISARMSSDEYSDDNSDVEFLDTFSGPLAQVFGLFQAQPSTNAPSPNTTNVGQSSQSSDPTIATNNSTSNPQQAQTRITRSVNRSLGRNTTGQFPAGFFDSGNQSLADVLNDFIQGVSFGTHFPTDATPSNSSGTSTSGAQGSSGSVPTPASRSLINIDFPLPFFLHSNPGDYAWGNAGFDAVITQLLNNLDGSNSGPPPMPKEQVDSLPTVKISDEQVKTSNLQCTVCMDDFQVGDSARQLPCEHFFHQDCILPWLNLHASCPICRKTFATGTNATQQNLSSSSEPTNDATATTATTNSNSSPSLNNSGSSTTAAVVGSGPNRNTSSSTATTTNQNIGPNYEFTEDDCD